MYRIVTVNGDELDTAVNIVEVCRKLAEYLDSDARCGTHKEIAYTVEWKKKPADKVLTKGQALLLADYVGSISTNMERHKEGKATLNDYIESEGGVVEVTHNYEVTTQEIEELKQFIIDHV